jgi:DsbC/DsbD-like thiol-disulfide interchange protein
MKAFLDIGVAGLLAVALPMMEPAPQAPGVNDGSKNPRALAQQRDQATPIWTDHLKLTTYPSEPAIAPGRRVSLILEIEPGEGMHVYAPGAESYRVITLTMATEPFVRARPMQYPPSEIYVFAPLNERIPVYQKPFTLRQELVLATEPQARAALRGKPSLTVRGTLEYQACDDKICFNPVSVPLSWTLSLGSETAQEPARAPGRR